MVRAYRPPSGNRSYEAGQGNILEHFQSMRAPQKQRTSGDEQQSSQMATLLQEQDANQRNIRRSSNVSFAEDRNQYYDYTNIPPAHSTARKEHPPEALAGGFFTVSGDVSRPKKPSKPSSMFALSISPPRRGQTASSEPPDMNEPLPSPPHRAPKRKASHLSSMAQEFLRQEPASVPMNASLEDQAHTYRQQYKEAFDLGTTLAKQVVGLEKWRRQHFDETARLEAQLHTQKRIIETLRDEHEDLGTGGRQHRKISALGRHIDELTRQLQDRENKIRTLESQEVEAPSPKRQKQVTVDTVEMGIQASDAVESVDQSVQCLPLTSDQSIQVDTMSTVLEDMAKEKDTVERSYADLQSTYQDIQRRHAQVQDELRQEKANFTSECSKYEKEKADLRASACSSDEQVSRLKDECEQLERRCQELLEAKETEASSGQELTSELSRARQELTEWQHRCQMAEKEVAKCQERLKEMDTKDKEIQDLSKALSDAQSTIERSGLTSNQLTQQLREKEEEVERTKESTLSHVKDMEEKLQISEMIRRSLHNKVMELKGNIRVFCRIRPVLPSEPATHTNEIFKYPDGKGERRKVELLADASAHPSYGQRASSSSTKKYPFEFDLVFPSASSQEEVFLEVSALVQSAIDGYNVCIFAYGQTGSGKTYTMLGEESALSSASPPKQGQNLGIVGRAIDHIFDAVEEYKASGWTFNVSLEMLEIYNESLRDLLSSNGERLDLRYDARGMVGVTKNCVRSISGLDGAWQLMRRAMARRATKTTNMNNRSSRSHCVISLRLKGRHEETGETRQGVVHLVDLAGSERLSKSGSHHDPELLKEAQAINKSLSALGNVITALAKKSSHVPYRDSKLTHLLSPSLGGDSKTLMICNLSPLPQHRDETLNSLRFAKTVNSCEVALPSYK